MECHRIKCMMNVGFFADGKIHPDGTCYAPENCQLRERIAALEAELAEHRTLAEMAQETDKREYAALYKEAQAAHVRVDKLMAERDALRADNARLRKALENLAEHLGVMRTLSRCSCQDGIYILDQVEHEINLCEDEARVALAQEPGEGNPDAH